MPPQLRLVQFERPLQPLAVECKCYRCHTGYVGRILLAAVTFVLLGSFVAWILS